MLSSTNVFYPMSGIHKLAAISSTNSCKVRSVSTVMGYGRYIFGIVSAVYFLLGCQLLNTHRSKAEMEGGSATNSYSGGGSLGTTGSIA